MSILLVKCELVVEIVTRIKLNKDRIAMVTDDREGDGHFPFARSIDYFHGGAERAGGKRIYFIGIGDPHKNILSPCGCAPPSSFDSCYSF